MGGRAGDSGLSRRTFVTRGLGAMGALALSSFLPGCGSGRADSEVARETGGTGFTEWGFRRPYRQVSEESIGWLKVNCREASRAMHYPRRNSSISKRRSQGFRARMKTSKGRRIVNRRRALGRTVAPKRMT